MLLCLLMTSCDLSDQTKGWKTTRKIAVSSAHRHAHREKHTRQ